MAKLLSRWSPWLKGLVAIAALALLLSRVDLGAVGASLGRSDARYVGVGLVIVTAAAFPAAWSWKLLMDAQGLRLPITRVHLLYAVGMFFASFTPGGIGSDVVRTFRLHQWTRRGVEAGVSILMARLLSLITLLIVVLGAWMIRPSLPVGSAAAMVLFVVAICALAVFVLNQRLMAAVERIPWRRLPTPFAAVASALSSFRPTPRVLGPAAALAALHHLLAAASLFLLAVGLHLDVALADVLALGLLARLVAFVPISIGGIGTYEAGLVVLLGYAGVGPAEAIALSLLQRLVELVIPLCGGIAYLAGWGSQPIGTASLPSQQLDGT
jgi:uncharacterized protein (TIRG00374 family)